MNYNLREIVKETDKRVVVVGLGKSGAACVKYLVQIGIKPLVMDTRATPPRLGEVEGIVEKQDIVLNGLDEKVLKNAAIIILSPGVSLKEKQLIAAAKCCVPIIGEIELFAQDVNAPVIAITGSNGKSTVTTLVGMMLESCGKTAAVGGNLGTPALELLQKSVPDYYVLELSSFQLETVFSLDAAASVILNITEDHMDRYIGIADYSLAKKRTLRGHGRVVVNMDEESLINIESCLDKSREICRFGLSKPNENEFGILIDNDKEYLAFGNKKILACSDVKMPGQHNLSNALAAMALTQVASADFEKMAEMLREFPGLPHRTQWVAEVKGVNWYNDSKATNVGATIAAVNGMPGKLVLIMGGDGKGADFSELSDVFADKVFGVILIGRDAAIIEKEIKDVCKTVNAKDMNQAVKSALNLALELGADSVLLSPACASWDMFCDGYVQRGIIYSQEVRELIKWK
ncbi:MAG: UDP-N-acetylmuramoyl-L-alanine--D-glutamate ligase [Gammaproteobacteria bacterium]|nr:MAG: UDP-N-acetylmuramoyl-L-alanine--D-glutamate ligase [Gammaproteobacteria bacterium]